MKTVRAPPVLRYGKGRFEILSVICVGDRRRLINAQHFIEQRIGETPCLVAAVTFPLQSALKINLRARGGEVFRERIEAVGSGLREQTLARQNMVKKAAGESRLTPQMSEVAAELLVKRGDALLHPLPHLLMADAKNFGIGKVIEQVNVTALTRHRSITCQRE